MTGRFARLIAALASVLLCLHGGVHAQEEKLVALLFIQEPTDPSLREVYGELKALEHAGIAAKGTMSAFHADGKVNTVYVDGAATEQNVDYYLTGQLTRNDGNSVFLKVRLHTVQAARSRSPRWTRLPDGRLTLHTDRGDYDSQFKAWLRHVGTTIANLKNQRTLLLAECIRYDENRAIARDVTAQYWKLLQAGLESSQWLVAGIRSNEFNALCAENGDRFPLYEAYHHRVKGALLAAGTGIESDLEWNSVSLEPQRFETQEPKGLAEAIAEQLLAHWRKGSPDGEAPVRFDNAVSTSTTSALGR